MNKPFLLFAVKCSVILYFAACTSIDHLTIAKSATPIICKGPCKLELSTSTRNKDCTVCNFEYYHFAFDQNGELKANKNGRVIKGSWSEDNISKQIHISFDNAGPVFSELNNYWTIENIENAQVSLNNSGGETTCRLKITSL